MLKIDEKLNISINYREHADLILTARQQGGAPFTFNEGDVVRFAIYRPAEACAAVSVYAEISEKTEEVVISLTSEITHNAYHLFDNTDNEYGYFPDNTSHQYWYDITLNPDTNPMVLVGYDESGPKTFTINPVAGGT